MVKLILFPVALIMVMTITVYSEEMIQKKLEPCPDKPNCVFSGSKDPEHAIEAYRYTGELSTVKQMLVRVIQAQARTKIVEQQDNYIHATFTSLILRFTDDVEFLFDDREKIIHVRSASRVGRSDFGVNRKRIETLRELFNIELKRSDKNALAG